MQAGTGQGSDGKSSFRCQSPAGQRDKINHSTFLIHQRSVSNKVSLTWLLVKPVGYFGKYFNKSSVRLTPSVPTGTIHLGGRWQCHQLQCHLYQLFRVQLNTSLEKWPPALTQHLSCNSTDTRQKSSDCSLLRAGKLEAEELHIDFTGSTLRWKLNINSLSHFSHKSIIHFQDSLKREA